ncbi:hypothetical protein ACF3DV_15835 [Chlorogloeopsis fritschii PCC 9212]|jgi:hypothetical protein|uniref:Uncharacterized protein n=1 Tax=Chlorogloeopsis fritschii PCC 6912 TaxID=211165 RepID=A0A433NKL2_CHLFR|nr:hypothetical protein [Chlorogloeopsis fritschii]RUR83352.1 hypothetical protein PCC6912_21850 [Chlorogloeopsis fritschii PCC 6912]
MTANYTSDELSKIAEAPMIVGMAVAMADLGIVSTAIEAAAMSKEIAGAAQKYPNNSIIQSVFSEEMLRSNAFKVAKPDIKPEEVQSGMVTDKAIAAVNTAVEVVNGKATPEEISEFKEFIYSCADAVANAAGSGLFGTGNPKVSPQEAATLTKLKAVLSV